MRQCLLWTAIGVLSLATVPQIALAGDSREFRTAPNVQTQGLPQAKEGKFPLAMPQYKGVDDLQVLDNQWVVLGVCYVPDIIQKIDKLSGGELIKACKTWDASSKAGRPNWTAYRARDQIRAKYLADARIAVGELKLGETGNYTITSKDDPAYAQAAHAKAVTEFPRPLGGNYSPYSGSINWGNYCIVELPTPMVSGKTYTISLGDGKSVTFLYDEMRTVSRAIKVNQVGYLASAGKKYAYLGADLYELGPLDLSGAKTFQVIRASDGQSVLDGKVELVAKNPRFAPRPDKNETPESRPFMYGEDVYRVDLTPLKETGEFFVTVPGVGRSWTFHHGPDTYGEAFYVATRGLYHQRCGIAIGEPYSPWPREKSTMHDTIYEAGYVTPPPGSDPPKGYAIFDAVGGTIDMSRKTTNVIGGWHDAADWDRNDRHYSCVFDMLNAYDLAPEKFTDGQLNLPESGNGIPDVLDEVEFGLRVWLRSQNEKGGVAGFVEAHTHPKMNAKDAPYAYTLRTRWDSLIFAAAAAQLAHAVKPFDAKMSATYATAAKKAYAFGADPANSLGKHTFHAKKNRGAGEEYTYEWEEKDAYVTPFLVMAKLQMYKLTGDKTYLDGVPDLFATAKKPWEWRFTIGDYSNWLYWDIAWNAKDALPAATVQAARDLYVKKADSLLADAKGVPYGFTIPDYKNYWLGWGASCMTNSNRPLYCAYLLTGDGKYRDAAIQNADFMLGANPLGECWTTGLGYVYPIDFQHRVSESDGIMDPVPGIVPYGTTGGPIFYAFRNAFWEGTTTDGKKVEFISKDNQWPPLWRSYSPHPTSNTGQCEFTVHETMAGNIFNAAMLMGEGWSPSKDLKTRKPRAEKYLFGYWQMP